MQHLDREVVRWRSLLHQVHQHPRLRCRTAATTTPPQPTVAEVAEAPAAAALGERPWTARCPSRKRLDDQSDLVFGAFGFRPAVMAPLLSRGQKHPHCREAICTRREIRRWRHPHLPGSGNGTMGVSNLLPRCALGWPICLHSTPDARLDVHEKRPLHSRTHLRRTLRQSSHAPILKLNGAKLYVYPPRKNLEPSKDHSPRVRASGTPLDVLAERYQRSEGRGSSCSSGSRRRRRRRAQPLPNPVPRRRLSPQRHACTSSPRRCLRSRSQGYPRPWPSQSPVRVTSSIAAPQRLRLPSAEVVAAWQGAGHSSASPLPGLPFKTGLCLASRILYRGRRSERGARGSAPSRTRVTRII